MKFLRRLIEGALTPDRGPEGPPPETTLKPLSPDWNTVWSPADINKSEFGESMGSPNYHNHPVPPVDEARIREIVRDELKRQARQYQRQADPHEFSRTGTRPKRPEPDKLTPRKGL